MTGTDGIGQHLYLMTLRNQVAIAFLIERQPVLHARATAGLDINSQVFRRRGLLILQQTTDMRGGTLGNL